MDVAMEVIRPNPAERIWSIWNESLTDTDRAKDLWQPQSETATSISHSYRVRYAVVNKTANLRLRRESPGRPSSRRLHRHNEREPERLL